MANISVLILTNVLFFVASLGLYIVYWLLLEYIKTVQIFSCAFLFKSLSLAHHSCELPPVFIREGTVSDYIHL
jgi:hypothetical protein